MDKFEKWQNGVMVRSNVRETIEENALRIAIDAAITDLNTIQAAALTTESSQIAAIKGMASIQEKLLRYIKRTVL